jgi:hypothetical protein
MPVAAYTRLETGRNLKYTNLRTETVKVLTRF